MKQTWNLTPLSKRLIKHTGYGNAAGLLARRGLMAGGRLAKTKTKTSKGETKGWQRQKRQRQREAG